MWQRLGRLGTVTEFWRVFTELNPETIRDEAERPFRLLLLGAEGSGKTTLAKSLAGSTATRAQVDTTLLELDLPGPAALPDDGERKALPAGMWPAGLSELPVADLYVYVVDASQGISPSDRGAIEALRRKGRPFVVLLNKCDLVENVTALQYDTCASLGDVPPNRIAFGAASRRQDVETIFAGLLLAALPKYRLALARQLPAMRAAVSEEIIAEAARVNAEFALLSNLPANIPLIGGIIGDAGDLFVLTKNQAMMLFKLGAVHGRDLRSKLTLIAEVAPVVGAAFLWRTVARELVGLLPSVVAAVPKTGIGYVGTYVVGKTAQYYYEIGSRPTPAMVQRFTAEATQRWRRIVEWRTPAPLSGHWPTKEELDSTSPDL